MSLQRRKSDIEAEIFFFFFLRIKLGGLAIKEASVYIKVKLGLRSW